MVRRIRPTSAVGNRLPALPGTRVQLALTFGRLAVVRYTPFALLPLMAPCAARTVLGFVVGSTTTSVTIVLAGSLPTFVTVQLWPPSVLLATPAVVAA